VEVFFDSHPPLHACHDFHVSLTFCTGLFLDAINLVLEVTYSPLCYLPSLYGGSLVDQFCVETALQLRLFSFEVYQLAFEELGACCQGTQAVDFVFSGAQRVFERSNVGV
jgi:hypothetical protein